MVDQDFSGAVDAVTANGADTAPAIGMISQYVKDLSFESPNAPAIFQNQIQPNIEIEFNIGAAQVGDEVHEVTLKIEVRAKSEDQTAFIVELVQGKGVDNLLDVVAQVWAALRSRVPDNFKFTIAGYGALEHT